MNHDIMADGLLLLIVGVTTVFLFLNIMILVMKLSSKLANYISKNENTSILQTVPNKTVKALEQSSFNQSSSVLLAVISAAIHKFRNENR